MAILYGCLAKDREIIADYPKRISYDARDIVKLILRNMPPQEHKHTWYDKGNHYHYWLVRQKDPVEPDGFVLYAFFCVATEDYPFRTCYNMIEKFKLLYLDRKDNRSGPELIKDLIQEYNNPMNDLHLRVKAKISKMKEDVLTSVDKIMNNLTDIDSLVLKTDEVVE